MMVVDASVLAEWLLRLPRARSIDERLADTDVSLHAPHLIDVEVAHVLRRLTSAGAIGPDRGRQALEDLADLDLVRHPHDVLLPAIWRLRENFSAYDAAYVALAEALGASLLTLDARLAGTPSPGVRVDLVS